MEPFLPELVWVAPSSADVHSPVCRGKLCCAITTLMPAPWIRLQWTNQIWACSEPRVDTKQTLLVGRKEMLTLGREGVTFAPGSIEAHIWVVMRWWLSYCGDRVRVLQPPKTSLAPEIPEQTGLLFLPIESYARLVWWPKPLIPAGRGR